MVHFKVEVFQIQERTVVSDIKEWFEKLSDTAQLSKPTLSCWISLFINFCILLSVQILALWLGFELHLTFVRTANNPLTLRYQDVRLHTPKVYDGAYLCKS